MSCIGTVGLKTRRWGWWSLRQEYKMGKEGAIVLLPPVLFYGKALRDDIKRFGQFSIFS